MHRSSVMPRLRVHRAVMGAASVGDYVQVRYSLVNQKTKTPLDGAEAVFDQGDVSLVVGAGGFIPGLHARLTEVEAVGVSQRFNLSPAECFGEANPALGPAKIPTESCPPGLKPGMRVRLVTGLKATVIAADEEGVTIDANHPLAGVPFEMKLELRAAPQRAAEVLKTATFAGGCFWGLECALPSPFAAA